MLIALLVSCVALDVARELCFKMSTRGSVDGAATSITGNSFVLFRPSTAWTASGVAIWGLEILVYAQVLAHLPLAIAFPIMSLTYAATPLAARLFLDEAVSLQRWIGIGLVTVGVMIVGTTGIS